MCLNCSITKDTVCHICKTDLMAEFDAKRKIKRERSEDLKPYASTSHLFNGVHAPSHVERDYVEQ